MPQLRSTPVLILLGAVALSPPIERARAQAAPESLSLFFGSASAAIRPQDEATLDQASRLYRDGRPIVMVVSGGSDSAGSARANLALSQRRANAVVAELVARGIPAERFQVVAKGETDPAVPNREGAAEPGNRRVDITWR